jgi:hypothetical protein
VGNINANQKEFFMTIEDLERELKELKRVRNIIQRRGTKKERQDIKERIKRNKEMREKLKRDTALKYAEQFVTF